MSERDWQSDFVSWMQEQDHSDRTLRSYEGALRIFSAWFQKSYLRPFAPRQLTAHDVREYRHELQNVRGLAASTINVSLAALRALAKWCIDTNQLGDDPTKQINFIELVPQPPRWMTRAELRKLLAEFERAVSDAKARDAAERIAQALRDQAAVALMAFAGLRISEVVQLDLVDLELKPRSGRVVVRQGKGRKERSVPLGAEVRMSLSGWLDVRGRQPGAMFFSQKGGRLNVRQLQRTFAERARRAGLEGHTPHSCRHTFVYRVVEKTKNLALAQILAGHRNIQVTARYAAPGREELAAAVEGGIL